jgi:ketosteroid isomerase-like protein
MKISIMLLMVLSTLMACQTKVDKPELQKESKLMIVKTEKDFETMAAYKGVAEAFAYYAADSAVINRGKFLITGKSRIKDYYLKWKFKDLSLKWSPDIVDVAASCDLGYTYGKYTFSYSDSTGKTVETEGYFHTVWKKQADGNWRFVWD